MSLSGTLAGLGTGLTIIGLIGLGYCVFRALAVRRGQHPEDGQQVLQKLALINMIAVALAFTGLTLVILSNIF